MAHQTEGRRSSLDAVEDLMSHPTFESEFMEVAKGLPDLERIVSRIHAKNCKTKDFLKVLKVMIPVVIIFFAHLPLNSPLEC